MVRRTFQDQYQDVLERVHALAGCCSKELPYVGVNVTQLTKGQGLNRHRDYRNHEEYLNYTINFGKYEGGHLEMLRNGEWQSCAVPLIWTEFTADIIEHRVREVTNCERLSVTLFTPSHLERLSERDWMNLELHGFPVHLYAERARAGSTPDSKGDAALAEGSVAEVHTVDEATKEDIPPSPALEAQQAEKAGESKDSLTQLADRIPQPFHVQAVPTETSLQQFALLTRDFNQGMNLPEGSALQCVPAGRGLEYGRMLRRNPRSGRGHCFRYPA